MNKLPQTDDPLVLRADFSDDATWDAICETIKAPSGFFQANVEFLSDHEYEGVPPQQLVSLAPQGMHSFLFVVDHDTLTKPDNPILVVDLEEDPGRTFRVIPSEMWAVENNLSLANMDFQDFAEHVDEDGVFRGLAEE